RGSILPAVRQKLHLSRCSDLRDQLREYGLILRVIEVNAIYDRVHRWKIFALHCSPRHAMHFQ
ncbi:hypothetical protein D6B98_39460, partial [Bradyrhizobium sp. LVM 105]